LTDSDATIKGSSYATAYFSGRLARYLADGGTPTNILDKFCQKIPDSANSVLTSRVRNGYFLIADMDFVEETY